MNEIKLSKMELRNFKGIKEFSLNADTFDTNIFGKNATGKTTLYDAFLYLLFDKDSTNRKDFSIKTHNPDGTEIHGLEHEVSATLIINDKPLNLRKMMAEKWTKKRGESTKEFTGHETSYWVDDVPVKKGEYNQAINEIIKEDVFKLLTNPFYFNNMLKWEDRRKILLEISGDVTDQEVIASDKSLAELTEILDGKTTENYRKIIAERMKKTSDDISKIPIRIDELSKTLSEDTVDYSEIESSITSRKAMLEGIEFELTSSANVSNAYRQKQQQAHKLQTEIDDRKKELDAGAMEGLKKVIDEKTRLEGEKYQRTTDIKSTGARIKSTESLIAENDVDLANLRAVWNVENEKQFVGPEGFTCPTCEQSIPQDKTETRIAQMLKNFEYTKAQDLAKISAGGKDIAARQKSLKEELGVLENTLMNYEANLADITERLTELDKEIEIERQRTYGANYDADPKYSGFNSQLQAINDELSRPIEDTTSELLKRKNEVVEQINALNKVLNNRDVAIKTTTRIDELKAEERNLAAVLSELERQKFLIEQFIKAKVNMLTDGINSRFKMVKFKLFELQINGALVECCDTMVNGVPWNDVNNGGQINGGLDIIGTLSEHYGVSAPIFIDNAESVTSFIDVNSQMIKLIVSEQDEKLRVEANKILGGN